MSDSPHQLPTPTLHLAPRQWHCLAVAWLIGCSLTVATQSRAADFFVDPINGSISGTGSAADPWLTLQQVIDDGLIESNNWDSFPPDDNTPMVIRNDGAPVKAGDTIWLRSGYHGEVLIRGYYNLDHVTVAAVPGHAARLSKLDVIAAEKWVFSGLSVSTSHTTNAVSSGSLVSISDHNFFGPTSDITFHNGDVFTIDDASSWDAEQWINDTRSAIGVGGDHVTISHITIRNVRFGISVGGHDALISHNIIDGFSADGIRGLGDRNVYEYNRIQNCFVSSSQGDGNHDDGFQSWSVGPGGVGTGQVQDVILRGNVFINYTDLNNPLNAPMQGIGCFDGDFTNWVVENNVLIVDHWHGISFYGMHDSKIVNNSVIDISPGAPGAPWIRITDSAQGVSNNNLIRNNLSSDFSLSGTNLVQDHNIEYTEAAVHFTAPPFDLSLLATSTAVDAGDAAEAPLVDVTGFPRPVGLAHDIGAYERRGDLIFMDGFD